MGDSGIRKKEDKAIIETRRFCISFMPSYFIKNYSIIHTIFRGKLAKLSRELSQTMLAKRTRDSPDTAA